MSAWENRPIEEPPPFSAEDDDMVVEEVEDVLTSMRRP